MRERSRSLLGCTRQPASQRLDGRCQPATATAARLPGALACVTLDLTLPICYVYVMQDADYIRQEARKQFRTNQHKTSAEEVAKAVSGCRCAQRSSILAPQLQHMLSVCCLLQCVLSRLAV